MTVRIIRTTAAGLAMAVVALAASSSASTPIAGSVDLSYGVGGLAVAKFGRYPVAGDENSANASYTDAHGRTFVVADGTAGGAAASGWMVAGFTADGKLNASFGSHGLVNQHFFTHHRRVALAGSAEAIAPARGGGLFVGGWVDYVTHADVDAGYRAYGDDGGDLDISRKYLAVVKYGANGRVVKSFGSDGIAVIRASSRTWLLDSDADVTGIQQTSGGGVVVYGRRDTGDISLFKLNRRGRPAGGFGEDGHLRVAPNGIVIQYDLKTAQLQLDAKGRILVAYDGVRNTKHGNPPSVWAVKRYLPNGIIDRSFGKHGVFEKLWSRDTDTENFDPVVHSILDHRGRVLMSGTVNSGRNSKRLSRGQLVRLTKNGKLDRTFAEHGVFTSTPPNKTDSSALTELAAAPHSGYVVSAYFCSGAPLEAGCHLGDQFTQSLSEQGTPNPSWGSRGLAPIPRDHYWSGTTGLAVTRSRVLLTYQMVEISDKKSPQTTYVAVAAQSR